MNNSHPSHYDTGYFLRPSSLDRNMKHLTRFSLTWGTLSIAAAIFSAPPILFLLAACIGLIVAATLSEMDAATASYLRTRETLKDCNDETQGWL